MKWFKHLFVRTPGEELFHAALKTDKDWRRRARLTPQRFKEIRQAIQDHYLAPSAAACSTQQLMQIYEQLFIKKRRRSR